VISDLGRAVVTRKTGREPFHADGEALAFDVLGFWQWSASDLISNATRGRLSEYVVANALGVSTAGVRNEWDAFDLKASSGIRIEVKSAAYIQSWHQKKLSAVSFITLRTRAWDPDTNVQSLEAKRQADVYVCALLAHRDKATIDPLNVNQWRFYVLPTAVLDARTRSQHSITLKSLEALSGGPVAFAELCEAVERANVTKDGRAAGLSREDGFVDNWRRLLLDGSSRSLDRPQQSGSRSGPPLRGEGSLHGSGQIFRRARGRCELAK